MISYHRAFNSLNEANSITQKYNTMLDENDTSIIEIIQYLIYLLTTYNITKACVNERLWSEQRMSSDESVNYKTHTEIQYKHTRGGSFCQHVSSL